MKLKALTLSTLFSIGLITQPFVHAADTTMAIEQIAEIMIEFENTPSDDDKITLDDIAQDIASTDNERVLATAIKNMDAKIRPADKGSIMKIFTSPSASEIERTLAKTLLRFDGKPSPQTQAKLSQWIEQ